MLMTSAPDTPMSRAAAHLDAAVYLALANARDDVDELLSPWAHTAQTINIAAGGLLLHLSSPVEPVEHPDCLSALRAAADEIARLRPDVDAPLADLVLVMEYLAPALQHAQAHYDGLALLDPELPDGALPDPELPDGPAPA